LATRRAKVVADALVRKGMVREDSHHVMFVKTLEGVATLVTRMSHESHEIDENLAARMAKQCCLFLREFWRLVDCPLRREEWDDLVRQRCVGGRNPFIGR